MNDGSYPPQEKEYLVPSGQQPYIDREDLEKLLLKVFKKKITVFDYKGVFRYTASRELTEKEIDTVVQDERLR